MGVDIFDTKRRATVGAARRTVTTLKCGLTGPGNSVAVEIKRVNIVCHDVKRACGAGQFISDYKKYVCVCLCYSCSKQVFL